MKPTHRRWLVDFLIVAFKVSQRRACRCIGIGLSSYRFKSQAKDQSALTRRLRALAASRVRFGYRRLHVLLVREGWKINRVAAARRLDGVRNVLRRAGVR